MISNAEFILLVKSTWSVELTLNSKVSAMESTKLSVTTPRNSRGMSVWACVAKTMTWTFDLIKGELVPNASICKTSLPQVMGGTREGHQTSEGRKKRLE